MIQLNLLPDLKKEFLKSQKVKGLVISVSILVTLAAIGISALLFVYVTFVQQLQISVTDQDIATKTQQLKDIPDIDKYLTIQNQLTSLPSLHAEKGMYSRIFDFLGVLNPPAPNNATFSSVQLAAADRTLVFTGSTTSFESLNVFVDTLKNAEITYQVDGEGDEITEKIFDQVLIQTSGFIRAGSVNIVGFTVKTVYREKVFAVNNRNMTAKVPNITTTPSVTQSPNPVFNDSNQTPGVQ